MAQRTEIAIVNAFKKLLSKRPLNKITISNIAEECGINRMTFYYHYRDVYDLIQCIADEELKGAVEGKVTLSDWEEGILKLLYVLKGDKAFYTSLYNSLDKEDSGDYVYELVSDLLREGVRQVPTPLKVTEAERKFITDFYCYAFSGLIFQWVRNGMKESPETIVERLSKLGSGGLEHGLEVFALDR